MRARALRTVLIASAALVLLTAAPAAAAPGCATPVTYPGDAAPKVALAQWMASGARARAIPGELPVMAALVESGLTNLHVADADSVGFFQMRLSIWNAGPYLGYPDNPNLQLKWFIDQALAVRAGKIAKGDAAFGQNPALYGEWVADVERPAEQYRYRYQLRLAEARGLIGPACAGLPTSPPPPLPLPDLASFSAWPKSLRVSKSGRFTYSFAATPGRSGKAQLKSTRKIKIGSKKRKLTVPAKSFTAPASGKVTLKFKLSAKHRNALKRVKTLKFGVTVTVGSASFTSTLKLKAPKTS